MTKVIRFLGKVILILADVFKMLSNLVKFLIVVGITLGVLMLTMLATFEAFHLIQPMEVIPEYGAQLDIFTKDIWAWVVAILGWTTMIYGMQKMFAADKAETEKMNKVKQSNSTWLD